MSERLRLLGGPYGGSRVDLLRTPPAILVGDTRYERIDDPDTGAPLGGYVAAERPPVPSASDVRRAWEGAA